MPLQDVERLKDEAQQAHAKGDLDKAIQLLGTAIKACNSKHFGDGLILAQQRNHLLSILYSNRAALHALTHAYVEALVDAKSAIANDGGWPKPYLRKATALLGLGQPHAALQVLDRGVAACAENAWALLSVRADVEVAAAVQQRAAKRLRPLPPLLHLHTHGESVPKPSAPAAAKATACLSRPEPSALARQTSVPDSIQGGPELVAFALDLLDASAVKQGRKPGAQLEEHKVAITVISGFLGAGKTTLLRRILTEGAGCMTTTPGTNPTNQPTKANGAAEQHTNGSGNGSSAPSSHGDAEAGNGNGLAAAAPRKLKFGVVVNDMASVNIDGTLAQDMVVAEASHVTPADRDGDAAPARNVVELSNGCICCGLKGDMLLEVAQLLCTSPSINYVVIESTGVGQPMPIAAAFASPDHRGRSLLDYVRVDCLVTVVDVPRFHNDMRAAHTPMSAAAASRLLKATLAEDPPDPSVPSAVAASAAPPAASRLGLQDDPALLDPEDNRPLAELLAEQIEFADVVLLNKVDVCNGAPIGQTQAEGGTAANPLVKRVMETVYALNPRAHLVPTTFCQCPLTEVINTRRFDFDTVSAAARWQHELLVAKDPNAPVHPSDAHESEMYGINSVVYEARRPFHPGRLRQWLNLGLLAALQPAADQATAAAVSASSTTELIQPQLPLQLLRSKGFFWLASCNKVAWEWSTAGAAGRFGPYGEWLAGKLPRRCWPTPGRRAGWDDTWGDRCSSLVFITHGEADLRVIKPGLDACLLTEEEVACEGDKPAQPASSAAATNKEKQEEAKESVEEEGEEEEETEDSMWFRREQAWQRLPGAAAWAALMQE